MNELLTKTFDFGIRIVELANYLEEEKKRFPLVVRLLECGTGIGVNLRIIKECNQKQREGYLLAFKQVLETEFLLELLVKTDFLYEKQSIPILKDCRGIKDEIGRMINNRGG